MSVIIEGWDGPKNCRTCDFREVAPYRLYCKLGHFSVSYADAEHRAVNCPIVVKKDTPKKSEKKSKKMKKGVDNCEIL